MSTIPDSRDAQDDGPYRFACEGTYDGFRPGKDPNAAGYMTLVVGGCMTAVFRVPQTFCTGLAAGDEVKLTGSVMQRSFANQVVIEHRPVRYEKTGPYARAASTATGTPPRSAGAAKGA